MLEEAEQQCGTTAETADGFDYVVTYRGATVHTETTAGPDFLQPALNLLDRIVSGAGR
ncbi:MAG: hypothetical protein HYX51_05785 [Chloroflexi bacterium]|nr:hypothetical protein [Chloroflexota bacterium]